MYPLKITSPHVQCVFTETLHRLVALVLGVLVVSEIVLVLTVKNWDCFDAYRSKVEIALMFTVRGWFTAAGNLTMYRWLSCSMWNLVVCICLFCYFEERFGVGQNLNSILNLDRHPYIKAVDIEYEGVATYNCCQLYVLHVRSSHGLHKMKIEWLLHSLAPSPWGQLTSRFPVSSLVYNIKFHYLIPHCIDVQISITGSVRLHQWRQHTCSCR